MEIDPFNLASGPSIIGATGGSGTRVVARIVSRGGMFIGDRRNVMDDSLDFRDFQDRWIKRYFARETSPMSADEIGAMRHDLKDVLDRFLIGWNPEREKCWGWKLPPSIFLLPFYAEEFSTASLKFLHLTRDGRDMAFSSNQNQVRKYGDQILDPETATCGEPQRSIALWNKINIEAADFAAKHLRSDQYLHLRFEDLCTNPVENTGKILSFFGLKGDVEAIAREEIAPPDSLGRWRGQDEKIVADLHRIAASGLERFGYGPAEIAVTQSSQPIKSKSIMPPICIIGVHRSGTSMVAKLLHEAGLDLGPQADWIPADKGNTEGHFEHSEFVQISDEILEMFAGWWDCPPEFPKDWADDPRLESLLHRGRELIKRFSDQKIWGWKDPRNSLTLPFWRKLMPDMKVVICVRNPLEVALSLRKRNAFSQALSFRLWKLYNERLLADAPASQRIITHYDAYFVHPGAEPRRVVEFCGLNTSDETIDRCSSSAIPQLRHNHFTTQHLLDDNVPRDVFEMYVRMCVEAGWLSDDGARAAAVARVAVAAMADSSGGAPPVAAQTSDASSSAESVLPRVGAWRLDRLELLRAELNAASGKIIAKDAALAELRTAINDRNDAIANLNAKLQLQREQPPVVVQQDSQDSQELREALSAAQAEAQSRILASEEQLKLAEQSATQLNQRIENLEQANAAARQEVLDLVHRLEDAARRDESARTKIESYDEKISEGEEEIVELKSRLEMIASREGELRQMLLDAHDQLLRRDEELRHRELEIVHQKNLLQQIHAGAAAAAQQPSPPPSAAPEIPASRVNYLEMVGRIKEVLQSTLPAKAPVAMVSKGDEDLVRLNGRPAWHFPHDDRGGYAGFHPADSADAITRLESIRKKGAQYLVLPSSSFWWMDHYKDFRRHLDLRYKKIRENDPCIVYELAESHVAIKDVKAKAKPKTKRQPIAKPESKPAKKPVKKIAKNKPAKKRRSR